jgi:transcription elongation factor Elf1
MTDIPRKAVRFDCLCPVCNHLSYMVDVARVSKERDVKCGQCGHPFTVQEAKAA